MRATRPRKPSGVGESVPAPEISTDAWTGCYASGWPKELLVPDAFSHPAKFAYGLIERIYDHARAEGWMPPGSYVLDPFAGVCLGALHALRLGCSWRGVELESKFFDIGRENISKWMHEYRHLPGWGPWAICVNGDSRRLLEHVPTPAMLAISSPPYTSEGLGHNSARYASNDAGRRDKVANSHKFSKADLAGRDYGETPGNLGAMPVGDLAVSSPPYADGCAHTGGTDPHPEHVQGGAVHHVAYGMSEGQLGAMPAVAVSSPPWDEGSPPMRPTRIRTSSSPKEHGGPGPQYQPMATLGADVAVSSPPYFDQDVGATRQSLTAYDHGESRTRKYGASEGQLGTEDANTFWEAARAVVAQTYALLRPGGHAIWVVKSYVRDKKLVDFPRQWRVICESVGFVTLHEHHAMLVEDHGTQETLFGEAETITVARKSFFRRLAERKGSPEINWETVYCMVKKEAP